jgi:hypothetical protein
VQAKESDLARAKELDPSIAEALRDRRDATVRQYIPGLEKFWTQEDMMAKLPKLPKLLEIKEPWRLKCLQD